MARGQAGAGAPTEARTEAEARTPTRVVRFAAGGIQWEIATRPPARDLRPFVRELYGYHERAAGPVQRREFPIPCVVVIFELGPPIRVFASGDPGDGAHSAARAMRFPGGGFVAGMDDGFSLTEHQGLQRGLQMNLTPLGARAVFGLPMSELAGRVVHVTDLLPRTHRDLTERLDALPDWPSRFALIEDFVRARVSRARAAHAPSAWAYARIVRRGGRLEVGDLARELGYSQTHFINLFRDQIGLSPKRFARLLRFDRLITHLKQGGSGTWADLALEFGYYDQAHLVRDVRAFTGLTPTHARANLINLA